MFQIDRTFGSVNPQMRQGPSDGFTPEPGQQTPGEPTPAFPVNMGTGDPSIQMGQEPAPAPYPSSATPAEPITPEPTTGNPNPNAEPTTGNPNPNAEPTTGNPNPNADPKSLEGISTFYLLSQALKEKGIFGEDFPLDTTASAAQYVEATAEYFNKYKENIREQEAKALAEQYQGAYEDIQYVLNGGSPETIASLKPLEQLSSIDMGSLNQLSQDEQLEIKQSILVNAMYLQGTKDQNVINYAIKGFIEDKTFDNKVQEAQQFLSEFVTDYKQNEIAQAAARRQAEEDRKAAETAKYVNSIKTAIQEKLVKGLNLDTNVAKSLEDKIFGKRTEIVEVEGPDNKVSRIAMTPWEKFITEFYNNPEVQLISFYNYIQGASGVNALRETFQRQANSKIIEELNSRISSTTQNPGFVPGSLGTPIGKVH